MEFLIMKGILLKIMFKILVSVRLMAFSINIVNIGPEIQLIM